MFEKLGGEGKGGGGGGDCDNLQLVCREVHADPRRKIRFQGGERRGIRDPLSSGEFFFIQRVSEIALLAFSEYSPITLNGNELT